MLVEGKRTVVGKISARHLRPDPQPMTTIKSEFTTASPACISTDFMQHILAFDEAIPDNSGTYISQYDQLYGSIGNAVCVLPSPIADLLQHVVGRFEISEPPAWWRHESHVRPVPSHTAGFFEMPLQSRVCL